MFQKFYSKLLARRLIQGTSLSEDAESEMITGLKKICGFEYTVKLQRMFTDIGLCAQVNEKLKEYIAKSHVNWNFDFFVQVLTAGAWPLSSQTAPVLLPEDVNTNPVITFILHSSLKRFFKLVVKLALDFSSILQHPTQWKEIALDASSFQRRDQVKLFQTEI